MTLTREQHSRYHMYRTAYGQKRADAYLAELRQAQAEQIARNTPLPATWIAARVDMTEELQEAIVLYGTAAALAGLEAAR